MKEKELLRILAFDGIEAARVALENEMGRVNAELQYKANMELMDLFSEVEKLPASEIVDRSYELTIKKDLLIILENEDLPFSQAQALLEKDCPLDAIYHAWLDNDYSYMDILKDSISDYAKEEAELLKHNRGEKKNAYER